MELPAPHSGRRALPVDNPSRDPATMINSPSRVLRLPGTLVLVFSIIVATAALTWIIPGGEFDRVALEGRSVVVPGTYHTVPGEPQGVAEILSAPLNGFVAAAEVIAFIFIVGGAFGLVNATGAVHASSRAATGFINAHPLSRKATIPLLMALFSLGGATFGMSEEVLAFIPVFLVFARALEYDAIVGIAIPFIGAGGRFRGILNLAVKGSPETQQYFRSSQ